MLVLGAFASMSFASQDLDLDREAGFWKTSTVPLTSNNPYALLQDPCKLVCSKYCLEGDCRVIYCEESCKKPSKESF